MHVHDYCSEPFLLRSAGPWILQNHLHKNIHRLQYLEVFIFTITIIILLLQVNFKTGVT